MPMAATPTRLAVVVDAWFDGERRHADGRTTFSVEDGRVIAIDRGDHGAALDAKVWRVERGAFLLPGLVDAHVHLFLDVNLRDCPAYSFHPNDNRSTVVISREEFLRYLAAVGNTYEFIELY